MIAKIPSMPCGHPLAAREIQVGRDFVPRTECWACAVEAEPKNRPGWPVKKRDTAA